MNALRAVAAVLLLPFAAFGQTPAAKAEFEVATIRPSAPGGPAQLNLGLHIDGSQLHCAYFSLKDYLGIAYKLKHYQITGPDWIASERFDISAKLPEGIGRDKVPEMLQALLTERFHIKQHRESKEFSVYALVVAKGGLKIKEAPLDPDAGADSKAATDVNVTGGHGGVTVNYGKGSYFSLADNRFEVKKLSMTYLADTLARFVDRPVVDMTELNGAYSFSLEFPPDDFRNIMIHAAIAGGVSLPPEALRLLEGASDGALLNGIQSLGMKLDSRKAPLEVLVIDRADKTPGEN